jgi:hypothetical protein
VTNLRRLKYVLAIKTAAAISARTTARPFILRVFSKMTADKLNNDDADKDEQ